MKKAFLLILVVLLSVMAGVQTAMAQKVTLYSAGSKAYECDIAQLDSIVFSEGQTIIPDEEIVVTVDANGNADGEHWFEKIDETNFYIDDIKYTAQSGDLVVTGYNQVFFKGAANIISQLKYRGRTMNVMSIAQGAFLGCSSLTSITIPKSVTSIGDEAFYDCSSLTSVTIPESVTIIGDQAFRYCYFKKESFVNNSSLTSDDNWGATLCDEETSDGLVIKNNIVVRCRVWAVSITIPECVTNIGDGAFAGCSSLTSITIPDVLTYVGPYAFAWCTGLTDVTIGSGVTSIEFGAFEDCSSLTSIIIPNSVTSIGSYAFSGCSSLTSVTIGSGVTNIGNRAFEFCSNLTSITIPESVTSIGSYAFYNCSSLTSVTMGSGMTSIGSYAFSGCSSLTSISIPENVTSIGGDAFGYCTSLTSVTLESNNIVSTANYYSFSMKTIFGNQVEEYIIGNSVTSIGNYAFRDCSSLTSITIPASVTSIGDSAFSSCSSLTDVYCYADNVPSTNSYAFYETPISSATLHVPAASVDAYKAASPWSGFGSIVAIE